MLKIFPSYQSSTKAVIDRWLSPQLCFSLTLRYPQEKTPSDLQVDDL